MSEKIVEAITEQWGERCPDFDADCACCQVWAEYDALAAALAVAPKPRVRKLEWKEGGFGDFTAETIAGTYEVGFDDGWWAQLRDGMGWEWVPEQDPRSYHGPYAAQAAAQADYEQRILSALEDQS